MDDQKPSFDEKFEEDEYPRPPVVPAGRTDAQIAQEQAKFVHDLVDSAHVIALKLLNDVEGLDNHPEMQEKKVNMAAKMGGLFAKLVATQGQHNKARRGY